MAQDKGEYGTRHLMEEDMRANGAGVFEGKAERQLANKMNPAPANKALSSMTKAELVETAQTEGVAFETDDNKADLIAKIEKARS